MIEELKARIRELSDADITMLADPQQPCVLRDHRVADELITALAREVRRLRAALDPRVIYAIDEAARTVTLRQPGLVCGEAFPFSRFTPGAMASFRTTAETLPTGYSAACVRAYEELVRRGLIAGEGVAGG